MKINTLLLFFSFAFLITICSSCNNSDDDQSNNGPDPYGALLVKFKLDGEQKEYSSTQGFWGGGTSGQGYDIWATNLEFSPNDISFEFTDLDSITEQNILGLNGQSISFETTDNIHADLYIDKDGIEAASYHADNSSSTSVIQITDVHQETGIPFPIELGKLFRVTGTFECNISNSSNTENHLITDGEFSLVFQEVL